MTDKFDYYQVDTGFLPQIVKLAFTDSAFQDILKDHGIDLDIQAFKAGDAETHYISGKNATLIIVTIDPFRYENDEAELVSVIAHEVCHVVDRLSDYIGGTPIGDEPRAYLTEKLVRQIYYATIEERAIHARKADRKVSKRPSKKEKRNVSKVDLNDIGGTGQDYDTPKPPPVRRVKDKIRRTKRQTETGI